MKRQLSHQRTESRKSPGKEYHVSGCNTDTDGAPKGVMLVEKYPVMGLV